MAQLTECGQGPPVTEALEQKDKTFVEFKFKAYVSRKDITYIYI